ncbi:EamA family transporter [Catenulispora yoronensis]
MGDRRHLGRELRRHRLRARRLSSDPARRPALRPHRARRLFHTPPEGSPLVLGAGISAFMFFGQYVLLFTGMAHGMPEGLSSLVLQCQAPFTVLAAALLLGERTAVRQLLGIAAAVAGLVVIGAGRGGSVPLGSLLLVIAAGASWALGSISNRKAGAANGFALMVWASLYAAPPLALASLLIDGPHRIGESLTHLRLGPVLSLLYVVGLSTFVGLGAWVALMSKYPASTVAPYTLGVPPIGMVAAAVVNGERMNGLELAGAAVVLLGLVAIVWPRRAPSPTASAPTAKVEENIAAAV